jgi:uncharacterized protein YecT (DUF1311 family)
MRVLVALLLTALAAEGAAEAGAQDTAPADCANAQTTIDVNDCLSAQVERSQLRLERYLKAAEDRYADGQPAVRFGIEASQRAFEAYRAIECSAVYEDWKDGTIRNAMALGCTLRLNDERTNTVWANWLQYMDSTPPILPEPGPTE